MVGFASFVMKVSPSNPKFEEYGECLCLSRLAIIIDPVKIPFGFTLGAGISIPKSLREGNDELRAVHLTRPEVDSAAVRFDRLSREG